MSINILDTVGLHTYTIQKNWKTCEDALTVVLLEDEIMNLEAKFEEELPSCFKWENPTNSMIELMFRLTKEKIKEAYPLLPVEYTVDGNYSSFVINNNEKCGNLFEYKRNLNRNRVRETNRESMMMAAVRNLYTV